MAVFWVVAPCSMVEVYQRFRGSCCLHHQGATTQKTAIFDVYTRFHDSLSSFKSLRGSGTILPMPPLNCIKVYRAQKYRPIITKRNIKEYEGEFNVPTLLPVRTDETRSHLSAICSVWSFMLLHIPRHKNRNEI
jgi:hypothetical protein